MKCLQNIIIFDICTTHHVQLKNVSFQILNCFGSIKLMEWSFHHNPYYSNKYKNITVNLSTFDTRVVL